MKCTHAYVCPFAKYLRGEAAADKPAPECECGVGKPISTPTEGSMEERFDNTFVRFGEFYVQDRADRNEKLLLDKSKLSELRDFITQEKERSRKEGFEQGRASVSQKGPWDEGMDSARAPKP